MKKKLIERRKSVVAVSTTKEEKLRFSSYWSNVQIAGWMRRFINNSKLKDELRNVTQHLSKEEIRNGELELIRIKSIERFSLSCRVFENTS